MRNLEIACPWRMNKESGFLFNKFYYKVIYWCAAKYKAWVEGTSNERGSRSRRQVNKIWDGNKENSKCIYSTYFKRLEKTLYCGSTSITPELKILRQED